MCTTTPETEHRAGLDNAEGSAAARALTGPCADPSPRCVPLLPLRHKAPADNGTPPQGPFSRGHLRWRKALVGAFSVLLALAIVSLSAAGFVQGSWWYTYPGDRGLDRDLRAEVTAVRDALAASGEVPQALVWLEAALDPEAPPTDVRLCLLTARDLLASSPSPGAHALAERLDRVLAALRSLNPGVPTSPTPASRLGLA